MIFQGDSDLIAFIQRLLGYGITGYTHEQKLAIFHGESGQNGKSLLANVLRALLGPSYSCELGPASLAPQKNMVRNDLAQLPGKRMVTCRELEAKQKIDESMLKSLTGEDPFQARFLYHEFFEVKPVCKLFIQSNSLPTTVSASEALMRRIIVVPFDYRIPDDMVVPGLAKKLVAEEASGILTWLVQGAIEYEAARGLQIPPVVQEATQAYQKGLTALSTLAADIVVPEEYIGECLEFCQGNSLLKAEVYKAYVTDCEAEGMKPASAKAFGQSMIEAEYQHPTVENYRVQDSNGKSQRAWYNVKFKHTQIAEEYEAPAVEGEVVDFPSEECPKDAARDDAA